MLPKIISKLSCESRKFNDTEKVMTSFQRATERVRFIFEVSEEINAVEIRDLGVEKKLNGAID